MFILIGRLLFIAMWAMMLVNLVHPFASPANILINVAFLCFIVMHGLQTLLVSKTLTKKERENVNLVKVFLFGAVEILSWKK